MCECLLVAQGIVGEVLECGFASLVTVLAPREEVLESAVFCETARIVHGSCMPDLSFFGEFAVSNYSIWFTNVLRQLVGRL